MQFKENKRKRSSINVTPLIDVLFILLIFFMVSSSFVEQPGMKLELPTIKSKEVARVDNLVLFVSSRRTRRQNMASLSRLWTSPNGMV